jgi:hypothetical protein
MASFSLGLPAFDGRQRRVAPEPARQGRTALPDDDADGSGTVAASGGPGWYESSSDLLRGLEVREGLPGDASIGEWLSMHLRV